MNFEHLVEINDPGNPLIKPLSREQLWAGLVLRAEKPQISVMGLDSCLILERREGYLKRELFFGKLRVNDEVTLVAMEHVTFSVSASKDFPASRLRIAIEEPFPDHLFLRFTYERPDAPATSEDEMVSSHLKQAYTQANHDTVAVIRRLESEGLLNIGSTQ